MEINVIGIGKGSFASNEVILNVNIRARGNTYDEALRNGSSTVDNLINTVLIPNGFKDEDLETSDFSITQNVKYNSEENTYENDGYLYSQNATLRFDYDNEILSNIAVSISSMNKESIDFFFSFGLKNQDMIQNSLICKAFRDGKAKAEVIANCAEKVLGDCVKAELNTMFPTAFLRTSFDTMSPSVALNINPKNVEVEVNLNMTWKAS